MKVLLSAFSVQDEKIPMLSKEKAGMPVIVGKLLKQWKNRDIQIDILTYDRLSHGRTEGNIKFIANNFMSCIKGVARSLAKNHWNIRPGLKTWLKRTYYEAELLLINWSSYDCVNIIDPSYFNIRMMQICAKKDIPVLFSLHILIDRKYKEDDFPGYAKTLEYQNQMMEMVADNNFQITVVSSGMKRRILRDYPRIARGSIHIIGNGIDTCDTTSLSLNDEDPNPREKSIFLCPGTLSERKNQSQILDALCLLPNERRNEIEVLFCGHDATKGEFVKRINKLGLADLAKYIGEIKVSEMSRIYQEADAVISTSKNEAFGLIFIEGFLHGKPALYFPDIDAAEDLYDKDSVCLIKDRDDRSVAEAMLFAKDKRWDPQLIKKHAKKFDIRSTANKYIELFKKITA